MEYLILCLVEFLRFHNCWCAFRKANDKKRGIPVTRTRNACDGIYVKSIWTKSPHYGWQQTSIISTIQCNLLLTCCRYRSHSLQNAWLTTTGENVAFNVESQCYANMIRSTISTNMIYIFAPFHSILHSIARFTSLPLVIAVK